jgi:cytochrome c
MKILAFSLAAAASALSLASTARAQGDPARGKAVFESRCVGCHSLDTDRIGPALGDVFGRMAGSRPGFSYSPALEKSGRAWTAERLDRWLTNPQALIPGAVMPFRLGDARERSDVIAFLRSLSRR